MADGTSFPWRVSDATLDDAGNTLWAYLTVENTSKDPIENTAFYAEYLDSAGRRCQSLIFTSIDAKLDWNANGRGAVFNPTERRRLYAVSSNQLPALAPSVARVYAFRTPAIGHEFEPAKFMSLPPTVWAGWSSPDGLSTLGERSGSKPYLAIVSISLDDQGTPKEVKVLDTVEPNIAQAIERLSRALRYQPAIRAGQAVPSSFLLLFVDVSAPEASNTQNVWPWQFPQIASAVEASAGEDVPTVALLSFLPEARDNVSVVQYSGVGTEWSGNALTWKHEHKGNTYRYLPIWNPGDASRHVTVSRTSN